MNVSQFELVYKKQSPAGPADVVLQGYFLEITNLEDNELQFGLQFTTSLITDVDRRLNDNTIVFVDTPGVNNNSGVFSLLPDPTGVSFNLNAPVKVPAKGTALVAVLPSDPFANPMVPGNMADFECRGYVTLSLPLIYERVPLGGINTNIVLGEEFTLPTRGEASFLRQKAQTPSRAKVLLTAQNRAIYTEPDTGLAKGQTQGSLPLANGQAENEVIAAKLPTKFPNKFDLLAAQSLQTSPVRFEDALAGMLATVQESEMDLKAFNAALKKSGVGMAIETRKL